MQHPWMRWSVRKPVQWLRHSFHGVAAGCPTPTPAGGLTATIAAELGETAVGSDHYQALFTLGILLFVVTFFINLTADLVVRGIRKS